MENLIPKKVLVADDDPDTVLVLEQGLKHAGYIVATARDGEEALVRFKEFRPDLVILDVEMPRLTGWEVLERIKSGWKSKRVPVMMLTARDSDDDKIRGYEHGVSFYVTKPFNLQKLLPVIRSLTRIE
ncbi:MAG: response regulator [Candidatus Ratteibacteria bacterium]|jgi:DNA-binding response OmpR family regulator